MNDHVAGKVDGRDSHVMIPDRKLEGEAGRRGLCTGADEALHEAATDGIGFVLHCVFSSAMTRRKKKVSNSTGLLTRSRVLFPCVETAFGGIVGVL